MTESAWFGSCDFFVSVYFRTRCSLIAIIIIIITIIIIIIIITITITIITAISSK